MATVGALDYRDIPTIGVRSGTIYYHSFCVAASATVLAMTAGRFYAQPFYKPGKVVDRIGIEVTVGSAGNCRLGFFSHSDINPSGLVLDCGTVDTTTNAIVEASFTAMTMPDAIVWGVAIFEATPTLRVGTGANSHILGVSSPSSPLRGVYGSQAYGALPSTAPSITGPLSACPMIMIRKS